MKKGKYEVTMNNSVRSTFLMETSAYVFEIPGFGEFLLHRSFSGMRDQNKFWTVTEPRTGLSIVQGQKTGILARKQAEEILVRNGLDNLVSCIKKNINEGRVTRYHRENEWSK